MDKKVYVIMMGYPDAYIHARCKDMDVIRLPAVQSSRSLTDSANLGNHTLTVPDLENDEDNVLGSKIELLFADMRVIAKYRKKFTNLKWVHSNWNGADFLMDTFEEGEPKPKWALTKMPGSANAELITEYVVGYILTLERHILKAMDYQRHQDWQQGIFINKTRYLREMTIGILGVGAIGTHLASVCKAFGMTVWGMTRKPRTEETKSPYVDVYRTIDGLDDLLRNCDIIVNLLPSTTATRHLLSGDVLKSCSEKQGIFINVGRGDVIDETTIVKAVRNKWIGGAVLDVFEKEPLPVTSPLWKLPQVIITPHVSGWTISQAHMDRTIEAFVENYRRYVDGKPLHNLLDWEHGY